MCCRAMVEGAGHQGIPTTGSHICSGQLEIFGEHLLHCRAIVCVLEEKYTYGSSDQGIDEWAILI